jgi:hypothetical protein
MIDKDIKYKSLTVDDFGKDCYKEIAKGFFIHKDITDLAQPIFRYMSFEHLLSMLSKKELYVANRSSFCDLSERGWKEKTKNVFPLSPIYQNKKETKRIGTDTYNRWKASYNICISCWSYDKHQNPKRPKEIVSENYLMWRTYAFHNIGCRIETTIGDLIKEIQQSKIPYDILFANIEYLKDEYMSGNLQNDLFTKPSYYFGEQEMRFCILCQEGKVSLKINPFEMIKGVLISPFITRGFSSFLVEQLKATYTDWNIPIQKSHVMEFF